MSKKESIVDFINMDIETYMKKRVQGQIDWMSGKSSSNKNKYLGGKFLVILLSVSIPFLVTLVDLDGVWKYVVGVAGVMIAGIEGWLSLYDFQNNWVNYRTTVETLKREQFLFATKTKIYNEAEAPNKLFVERIENILSSENKNWVKFSEDDPSTDKGKKA